MASTKPCGVSLTSAMPFEAIMGMRLQIGPLIILFTLQGNGGSADDGRGADSFTAEAGYPA